MIAIGFAFNDGRSRTSWQGFSLRWFYRRPELSVWHDPTLQGALEHSLELAVLCVPSPRRSGRAGDRPAALARARARPVNVLMLLPLVTPEIVMGVALLLVFTAGLQRDRLGTTAQVDRPDHVHDLVRGGDRARPAGSIGPEYEEAARRPRAPPSTGSAACCCRCSRRRSSPAPRSSSRSRSTTSSSPSTVAGDASTTTVSMLLYASARGAPTPALNALATIALFITLGTLALVYFVYRRFAGGGAGAEAVASLGGVAMQGRDPARVARQVVRRGRRRGRHRPGDAARRVLHDGRARRAAARRRRCA